MNRLTLWPDPLHDGCAVSHAPVTTTRASTTYMPADEANPYGGQTASEVEQTRADHEQTQADREQTGSDRDQSSADRDQIAADRDQLAADADQAASDRD